MKLEWVDPVEGASKLPATDMQPVPKGADALTKRYHRLFAATMQRWWKNLRGPSD